MPRIRTIKPAFWTDEKLGELPRDVRLLYLGLISAMADDEGRCKGNARLVKAAVYPLDDDVTAGEIEGWLTLLHDSGRIDLYCVNGERFIQIVKWALHQRIDKPQKSQMPAAEPESIIPRTLREPSANLPGTVREESAPDVEGEGEVEGNGKGNKPHARGRREATWVDEAVADYEEANEGTITHGHVGRALKPLVKRHGWDVVRPEWRKWVRSADAGFGPEVFARTFGQSRGPPKKPSAAEESLRNSEIAFGIKLS